MRNLCSLRSLSLGSCLLLGSACFDAEYPDEFEQGTVLALTPDGSVAPFASGAPSGAALPDAGGAAAIGVVTPGAAAGAQPTGTTGQSTGSISAAGGSRSDAGTPPRGGDVTVPVTRPDASTGPVTRDASVAPEDAGTTEQDSGSEPAQTGTLASCTITASTDAADAFPYTNKYGCAVWIANNSKKVVKAFMLATRISTRSGLPTYRTQVSGVTVDVVAQATLGAAKQHSYTWDMKGPDGATVPAGQYSLNVETHSENGTVLVTVPFDTSGAVSAMGAPKGDINSAAITCK